LIIITVSGSFNEKYQQYSLNFYSNGIKSRKFYVSVAYTNVNFAHDTRLVLFTGERSKEQMARYEENLYLKAVLEGLGNKPITLHEMSGFDHGSVLGPACLLIKQYMR
jgi:hypothetical protein